MTIRRGEPWGSEIRRPTGAPVATSDAGIASRCGQTGPVVIDGGDLWRSLGSPVDRDPVQLLPIDLLDVTVDDRSFVAAAHVIVRRSWWRGAVVAAMNVGTLGEWDVAPRSHPNDGRMDIVEVESAMSVRQRWQARSRLPTGAHVPHPSITIRSGRDVSWRFERPMRVWIDGYEIGRGRAIEVVLRPDAMTVAA